MAGAGTGPAVLRLTDCSLLVLPRVDPDGRTRYAMLETLRAYAAGLLCQAGEDEAAEAALAGYAAKLAAEAAVRLQAGITEVTSLRQLDAEDATVSRAWPGPWTTTRYCARARARPGALVAGPGSAGR